MTDQELLNSVKDKIINKWCKLNWYTFYFLDIINWIDKNTIYDEAQNGRIHNLDILYKDKTKSIEAPVNKEALEYFTWLIKEQWNKK